MTQRSTQSNQKNNDKLIKKPVLSTFYTRIIDGKTRISHFEIARQFDLNPINVAALLDDFRREPGQGDTVVTVGTLRWADAIAFTALRDAIALPEYLSHAVLAALGYFPEHEEILV